jgi:hypothetical protein
VLLGTLLFVVPFCTFASPLAIVNSSFDSDVLALNGISMSSIIGWSALGSQGAWAPTALRLNLGGSPGLVTNPATGIDGSNVAFSNGGTISQTLASTLASSAGMVYTLSVDIGRRFDIPDLDYSIALFAGATPLASIFDPVSPTPGTLSFATLQYTSTGSEAVIGQNLSIRLITTAGGGAQTVYDKVTLDATQTQAGAPEPASALLMLTGIGVVCLAKRKRVSR